MHSFGKERSVIYGQVDLHLVVRIIPTLHLLSTISHVGQIVHCDTINAKNVLNETCLGALNACYHCNQSCYSQDWGRTNKSIKYAMTRNWNKLKIWSTDWAALSIKEATQLTKPNLK